MNKVYKVLFNKSIGKYVVVSENSKSAKKSSKTVQSIVLAAVAFSGTSITMAAALALGGGTATGTDTIAIGESANATKANGIAIGSKALASEINAIAMGFNSNSSGENSTAIGNSSVASKQGSIALGQNTESSGEDTLSIGTNAKASTKNAISLGVNSLASGENSTSLGLSASALANDSISIGTNAKTSAVNTIALGINSQSIAKNAVAIGLRSEGAGIDSISIGTNAKTSDVSTIALGVNSQSIAKNAVAIGLGSEGAGTDSISIGTNAKTSAVSTIALGINSQSIAGNAVAIGLRSEGAGTDSISIGTNAKTSDVNTIALGINSKSLSGNAVAIGLRSEGAGRDSIAIGSFAKTSDVNSIALGNQAAASKANTIALGTQTKAAGANAIALGNQADASVFQSIALGTSAKASATDTVALGTGSIASGNSAIALGNKAQALGSNSISIGKGNIVSGKNSAAIGDLSNISGNDSYSLGNNNTITTDNTFVVGSGVTVNTAANTVNGNVILGNSSADKAYVQVSKGTINGKTYNYEGTAAGVVSVGAIGAERQIVNVAPGAITATSTDAINGSQLYATNEVLGNVANSVETILGGNATFNPAGNITMTNIGNTGKNTIHDAIAASQEKVVAGTNIASVDKVTDAVKGQSTYTVNANGTTASAGSSAVTVTAGTPDANNVTDYAVDLSQDTKDSLVKADTALQSIETQIDGVTVKNVNKDDNKVNFVTGDNVELTANADGSITVGTAADVTFNNVTTNNLTATGETKLGDNFTVTKAGDAYYTGPVTEGNHITNKTYVDQQTAAAKTEVAAGTNVKDVVKTQGTNGQDIYTVNANGTTASAGSSAVTVTAGTPDANNVTDYAVDLSQDTKDSLVKADTALQSIETQIDGVTVKNVNKDDNKVNFVTGDNVELTANADGSITVGTAADVTFNNVTTNNLTATGETKLGDNFTVTNAGDAYYTGPVTEGNHITNKTYVDQQTAAAKTEVAAGTNVKDVVKTQGTNGQDIYTVNANGTTASAGSSAVTVTAGTPDANNVTDYAVDLSQDTKDSLVKADTALQSIETQIDGVTVKNVNKDDNKVNFVTGDNVELTANADGSITVGTAADVTFNNVTTNNLTATGETKLGDNFTVTNAGDAYYTGPVTEGNHITNKTYVDQQTAAAKTEVAAGTNVKDVVKTQGTNGQDIYTVNANGTTASAGSSAVTVTAGTPDANNVTDYAVDLSQDTKDSLVKADTALQSIETQIDGVTVKNVNKDDNKVNFVTGDNVELTANADGSITVGTAADVTFNNVTTNNLTATGETKLGDNFTVTNAGDAYYTGPVTEGNHITNKTYVDQQTAAAKTEVAAGTNVKDVVKTQGTNGQDIYTVNANGTTASAGSSAVTVTAGTPDANNVTDYAVDLSQDTKDSLVKADSALQSIETQIDGVTVKNVNKDDNKVNFVTGDNIVLEDDGTGAIKVSTAQDVTFNQVNTTNLYATGETKLGDNFTVTNAGDAYYTGPVTEGNHITNKTYVDQQTAAAKTEVEAGKNITVTPTTGNDGQTIYNVATADEVDFTKVTVGNTTITTDGLIITGGPSITTAGINAGGKKVTDVADGEISEDSTDAVNGSQLHTLGNNVTNLFGGNATYVDNQISWNNIGGTGQNTIDDAIKHVNNQAINANQGWNVVTDSGAASQSTVKPGNTVSITGDAASGVTVTNTGNDITVGLGNQVTIGSGDNAVSIDGNAGTIQVGDIHIDGSKGNITAGQVKVNGEAGTVNGLTNTTWNPGDIVSGQAATEDQLKQVADTAAQAAAAAKSTVTEGENITVTPSKNADGSTNYQVATKKDVTFDSVTSGSVIADKVAVGKVVIDQAGINAGGNKVTNVADGAISSTSKDAINGSQLHASNTNIYNYLGGGANYETNTGPTYNVGVGSHNNVGDALNALDDRDNQLDNKITNLGDQLQQAFYTTNERIDGVEKRANAGIAAAMALETAPYVAGKWTYAAAAAHHGGENAVGVTFRKTADNGRWSLTSGIAAASQGDPSFRIGISGVID